MDMRIGDLAGKVVLVTGASTGIGAAVARGFAAQGALVGVHCNASVEAGRAVVADCPGAVLIEGDMSRGAGARSVVEQALAAFGRLDGLVNNAGGMVRRVPYAEAREEDYDDIMDLNARSVVVASQAAIGALKAAAAETGTGFIINTTSIAARNGASGGAGLYGSAKAFVHNVTRGMAKELIPFGIRVNAVAPGVILTPFQERYSTAAQLEAQKATVPAGRFAGAEECVGAYLFLASKAMSGYVVGQVIEVNGGQLMP